MDGVIQIFTHRGPTRHSGIHGLRRRRQFRHGSRRRGTFRFAGTIPIIPPEFPTSKPAARAPTTRFAIELLSGNFGWRISDTARIKSLSARYRQPRRARQGRRSCSRQISPTQSPIRNFYSGLHAEFATGSHWQHQVSGTELYSREFNFDPSFPSFYQYNRAAFTGQSTYLIRAFAFTAGYEYEVENGFLSDGWHS